MNKLKFSLAILLALAISFNFTSCNKDDFTEEDAIKLQNDLQDEGAYVTYTVAIVDASNTLTEKSTNAAAGLDSFQVTLTQSGKVMTAATDAAGMAVFSNLLGGTAFSVVISKTGYATCSYVDDIQNPTLGTDNASPASFAATIPMINLADGQVATIKGKVIGELDLTNKVSEPISGATVKVTPTGFSNSPKQGNVTSMNYQMKDDTYTLAATTGTDGTYSIKVPTTLTGIEYDVEVEDFEATQKIVLDTYQGAIVTAAQNVAVVFGHNVTETPAGDINDPSPVSVTMSAPDYTPTDATVVATVDGANELSSVNLLTPGQYLIKEDDDNYFYSYVTGGTKRAIVAVYFNDYGRIEYIEPIDWGFSYQDSYGEGFTTASVVLDKYIVGEITSTRQTADGNDSIVSWNLREGDNLMIIDEPKNADASDADYDVPKNVGETVEIISTDGANAKLKAEWFNNGDGTFSLVDIVWDNDGASVNTNGGKDYKQGDLIVIALPGTAATAEAVITKKEISSLQITNRGEGYNVPDGDWEYMDNEVSDNILIEVTGGNGEIADWELDEWDLTFENGKLVYIQADEGGIFETAPTIKIINKNANQLQKDLYVEVTNGEVTDIDILNPDGSTSPVHNGNPAGIGYSSAPTLTFTNKVTGAAITDLVVKPVMDGTKVIDFDIIYGGEKIEANTISNNTNADAKKWDEEIKGNGTFIFNFDLGVGEIVE